MRRRAQSAGKGQFELRSHYAKTEPFLHMYRHFCPRLARARAYLSPLEAVCQPAWGMSLSRALPGTCT